MTNLQKKILELLKQDRIDYKNYNHFFSTISKLLKEDVNVIAKAVNKMISNGDLIENGRKIEIRKNTSLKKGIIVGNRRGFAFVKPITEFGKTSKRQIDLFIAPNKLFGAFDGDEVLYKEEADKSASVVKILRKNNEYLIGRIVDKTTLNFKSKMEGEGYYVIPDNDRLSKPIFIPKKELNSAKLEDRVEIEITFQPEGARSGFPVGKVKRILPQDDDIENGIISILCEHQIPDEFPRHVLEEAEKLQTNFETEKKKRIDLTKELIVTIDGEDAKDFDDAISINKTNDGYTLGVHIADVGNYVLYGSEIDKEAFIRGTSVYFPDRVHPMLPERLSNFLCSLRPNEEKLALSVEMQLDKFGVVKSYKIFESVIKSSARLTYNQVYDVIKKTLGDKTKSNLHPLFPEIQDKKIKEKILLMNELSKKISVIREKEGMLDFNIPETYFEIKDKEILAVKKRERNDAHQLIENFMILCNQVVAKHFAVLKIPFVYRVHEAPAKVRVNEVIEIFNGFGLDVKLENKITPIYIQSILKKLKGKPMEEVGNKILLRSLEKALYLEDCLGHFGLALKYYCHFTSPIRRYPDLTIHRIIKRACRLSPDGIITSEQMDNGAMKKLIKDYELEEFVADSSLRSSERELQADEAERDVDDLFKAKFMEDKIGQEFEGRISGISSFGFFVELPDTIEGLIKIENLPDDDYKYDEKKLVLKGKFHKYTIGDKIKVKLVNVSLTTRRIGFELII